MNNVLRALTLTLCNSVMLLPAMTLFGAAHAQTVTPQPTTAQHEAKEGDFRALFHTDADRQKYLTFGGVTQGFAGGNVNWYYNDANRPGSITKSAALTMFGQAMSKWESACNVRFHYQGETTATPDLAIGCNLPPSTTNLCDSQNTIGWYAGPNGTAGIGGVIYGSNRIMNGDVWFNSSYSPNLSTVVHELGHMIGIAHSDVQGALMSGPNDPPFPSTSYTFLSDLQSDDVAACIALYGAPANTPNAAVTPTSLSFSHTTVGQVSPTQNVTLRNNGTSNLVLSNTMLSGSDYEITYNACSTGVSLAPNATCVISVRFKPIATGTRNQTLTVVHNGNPSSTTVALSGTGTAPPEPLVSVAPTSNNFGNVVLGSSSAPVTINFRNIGTAPLVLSAAPAVNGSGFTLTSTSCTSGLSLAVNASCTTTLVFSPTAVGSASGSLVFNHNATPSSTTVNLAGTGTAPPTPTPVATVSPATVNFGSADIGGSAVQRVVTFSNSGTASMTLNSVTISGTGFTIASSTCSAGQLLAAGTNCTVRINFAPTTSGGVSGGLVFAHTAGAGTSTVSLSGVGVVPANPDATRMMIEYRHKDFDYYFMSSRVSDHELLDGLSFWERTGYSFKVYETTAGGRTGITRYFFAEIARGQQRGTHFFTLLESDIAMLSALNPENAQTPRLPYNEGIDSYAIAPVVSGIGGYCAAGLLPVYRIFRGNERFPDDANHRFTTSVSLYNQLVTAGWTGEGVNFCVP